MSRAADELIIFREACELIAKRLDVDDVDAAQTLLCEELAEPENELGRDWSCSLVMPKGGDVTDLWRSGPVVDRSKNKATFKRVFGGGGLGFEDVTAHTIRVASTVVERVAPAAVEVMPDVGDETNPAIAEPAPPALAPVEVILAITDAPDAVVIGGSVRRKPGRRPVVFDNEQRLLKILTPIMRQGGATQKALFQTFAEACKTEEVALPLAVSCDARVDCRERRANCSNTLKNIVPGRKTLPPKYSLLPPKLPRVPPNGLRRTWRTLFYSDPLCGSN